MSWLLDRLPPRVKEKNTYVLLGAVHWMHGLALHCKQSDSLLHDFYSQVQPKNANEEADNRVFLQIMMSLHYLCTLKRMKLREEDAQVFSRVAIVSWYYGILNAAKAMNTATDNSDTQTHIKAANEWDIKISSNGLALSPFHYRVSTLVKKTYSAEIAQYSNSGEYKQRNPTTLSAAEGICCSYLSGTANWYREKEEIRIKNSQQYKQAGYSDFKTKNAKNLRDSILSNKTCGFLHEAFRYRGKSNYRDVTYLAHTEDMQNQFVQLLIDLDVTLDFFIKMAIHYCFMRLDKDTFRLFMEEVTSNPVLKDVNGIFHGL